jgi:TonB family protein
MSNAKRVLTDSVLLATIFLFLITGSALFAQDPLDQIPGGVYRPGHGVTAPKPFYTPQPEYTDKARREKINGSVVLTMVVMADGHVRDVKIFKGLDEGLNKQAIAAVRTWRFKPGTKNGKPVAVELSTEVTFRLY